MTAVLPKISMYLFISVICLFINFAVLTTVLIGEGSANYDDFTKSTTIDVNVDAPDDINISATDFAFTGAGSFVPFFSLLPINMMNTDIPLSVTIVHTIIIAIIGSVQAFLIFIILLNLAPKILGSGFDV